MAKILIVEDDVSTGRTVAECLLSRFHVVEVCLTISDAAHRIAISDYDLLILDWNMPDGQGIEILRSYRRKGGVAPVLMLTAQSEFENKETGFELGADDYLTKPFNVRELLLRVDALLRRPRDLISKVLRVKNVELHPDTFRVFRGEEEVRLLPKEFALLEFLMRHPDKIFSAEHLLERVWRSDSESMVDTVVTTVRRLRRKIDDAEAPSLIENVRGVGYRIRNN